MQLEQSLNESSSAPFLIHSMISFLRPMKMPVSLRCVFVALLLMVASFHAISEDQQSASNELRPVVVTGAGLSADAALKNAFTIAVEQTVGTLVDAKTLVSQNDKIEEQVITASNGFVKSYQIVRQWNEGGLIHCRITAQVKVQELQEKLETAKIATVAAHGPNLAARIYTQEAAHEGAKQLLAKYLAALPEQCLRVSAGEVTPANTQQLRTHRLKVPLALWVEQQAYATATNQIKMVLDRYAVAKLEVPLVLAQENYNPDGRFGYLATKASKLLVVGIFSGKEQYRSERDQGPLGALYQFRKSAEEKLKAAGNDFGGIELWDAISRSGSTTVHFYIVAKTVLGTPLTNTYSAVVHVGLRDDRKTEIQGEDHSLKVNSTQPWSPFLVGKDLGSTLEKPLMIVPGVFDMNGSEFLISFSWRGDVFAEIDADSLPKLRDVNVSVLWKSDGK
jgi:hypothetical protein